MYKGAASQRCLAQCAIRDEQRLRLGAVVDSGAGAFVRVVGIVRQPAFAEKLHGLSSCCRLFLPAPPGITTTGVRDGLLLVLCRTALRGLLGDELSCFGTPVPGVALFLGHDMNLP